MIRERISIFCLLAVQTVLGCGSLEASICDKRITCEGGNDQDRAACVDRIIGQTQVAVAYGCAEARNTALTCQDTSGTCVSSRFTSNCDAQFQAADSCINAAASPNFR